MNKFTLASSSLSFYNSTLSLNVPYHNSSVIYTFPDFRLNKYYYCNPPLDYIQLININKENYMIFKQYSKTNINSLLKKSLLLLLIICSYAFSQNTNSYKTISIMPFNGIGLKYNEIIYNIVSSELLNLNSIKVKVTKNNILQEYLKISTTNEKYIPMLYQDYEQFMLYNFNIQSDYIMIANIVSEYEENIIFIKIFNKDKICVFAKEYYFTYLDEISNNIAAMCPLIEKKLSSTNY